MKKLLSLLLSVALLSGAATVFADTTEKNIDVFTNYVNVNLDGVDKPVRNFLSDGTTYIALRDVSELLKCKVDWDDTTKTAVITTDATADAVTDDVVEISDAKEESIAVLEDYVNVTIDGEKKNVRNFLSNETTYIALRDVSELLDCIVTWDDTTKTALIKTPKTVISVNGTQISSKKFMDMYGMLDAYYGESVSTEDKVQIVKEALIKDTVVNAKADELEVGDREYARSEVLVQLSMMDAEYGTEFVDQILAVNGYTRESYIDSMVSDIIINALMSHIAETYPEYAKVRDGAEAYYKSHKNEYKEHSVQVKHILISTVDEEGKELPSEELEAALATAKTVAKKATAKNFDSLIAEYGNDPGQPEDGYLVKNNGEFVPEFEAAALKLKKGEVSEPVKTSYGYHIILATAVNEYVPYDEFLETYLIEKYTEIDEKYIEQWIKEAEVVCNDDEIVSLI